MARGRDEEYDNTNQGALFDNKRRRNNSRGPEWRGEITIKTPDGEVLEYWVSCWEKESRKGDAFLSLALDLKEDDQRRDRRGGGRDRDRDDDRRSSRDRDRDDDRGRDRDDRDDRRSSSRDRDDRGDPRDRDRDRKYDDEGDRKARDDDGKRRAGSNRDLDDEVPF